MSENYIIVAECTGRGADNDLETLGLCFHQGPTFINAYCQAATNLVYHDRIIKQTFDNPGFLSVKLTSLHTLGNMLVISASAKEVFTLLVLNLVYTVLVCMLVFDRCSISSM